MALVDELKKKQGMYGAANAELANAASQTAANYQVPPVAAINSAGRNQQAMRDTLAGAAYTTGANYQNPVVAATRAALPNAPQGTFPSPFDVGTSGQRSLVGQNIVDPIKGFFERSAAQARGDAVPNASAPAARALTAGIVPAANAAAPTQPGVSSAYPDETQRGAAKTALSQLANVPAQPSVPSLPNGYRVSDTSVSGVKRVDGGSSPLFTNIDPGQAVSEIKGMKSGTGVIGADGSNFSLAGGKLYEGRIVNSGYEGAGVAPNTDPTFRNAATRQFQGAENQRFATSFNEASRKNLGNVPENKEWHPGPSDAFAQQYRVGQDGKLQGYEIDRQGRQYEMGERQRGWNARNEAMNNSPSPYEKEQKERRDLFAKWDVESQLMRVADPAKRAELSMRLQDNLSGQEYRGNALSQLARDKSADRELDAQRIAQTGEYSRGKLTLDQQEAGTRALTTGINDRKSQAEMAEMQRIGKLRDAYMAEQDPAKKEQIGRALLTLQGKEPNQPRDDATKERYGLIGELAKSYSAMPPMGADGKPVPFEQYAAPVLQMANGNRGGQQADPRQQEGQVLDGKDGKKYVVRNGVPVPL